jgi:hypothetical protein
MVLANPTNVYDHCAPCRRLGHAGICCQVYNFLSMLLFLLLVCVLSRQGAEQLHFSWESISISGWTVGLEVPTICLDVPQDVLRQRIEIELRCSRVPYPFSHTRI